jgi:hypothetical protein
MRRAVVLLLSLMVITGCGGNPGTDSTDTKVATVESLSETVGTDGAGTQVGGTSSDGEPIAEATVTIGAETLTFREKGFRATANCRANDNGTFRALLGLVDEAGENLQPSELDLNLVHDSAAGGGGGDNSIGISLRHLDDGSLSIIPGWYAGADRAEKTGLPPAISQVDSFVIDGNSVSGTATFVDTESDVAFFRGEVDSVDSVQGTFSVVCGR